MSGSVAAFTGLHVPLRLALPDRAPSQVWQSPEHVALQQYPSTQRPLMHSLAPTHALAPSGFFATQACVVALQYVPLTQVASEAHATGHDCEAPSQSWLPAQAEVRPADPSFAGPQVPSPAPDCFSPDEHAAHGDAVPQAVSQQTPSVHVRPVAHSRHAPCCAAPQSVVRLHALPFTRCATHVPATVQYMPVGHSASDVQTVGHSPPVPSHRMLLGHAGDPLDRAARTLHVPSTSAPAAVEHTSQPPEHALAQQTSSTQV